MTQVGREQIEAQYLQSAFVKEICVLGLDADDAGADERLAVVVPDLEVLRERRIVNIGDLLRFELEGQAVFLPPEKRAPTFEVWFTALPRTATGDVDRDEVRRRVRAAEARKRAAEELTSGSTLEAEWADDSHANAAVEIIRGRSRGRPVLPDANIEIDLGLDSIDRVELLTELEQRCGVRIAQDRVHEILTVAQLIEAVRPREAIQTAAALRPSWAVLLKELPSTSDPALKGLLGHRPIAMTLLFAIFRILRLVFGPSVVEGRHHLPLEGPYIISPNHACYLDPFIVCGTLPYRVFQNLFVVGASEYFETPVMRWLGRKINLLPVDPDTNLIPAMKASALGLQRGKILMVFPEGERSIDGMVKRFKKGAPILAQHLGVPIVPVAIRGAFEVWPRSRAISWRALLPFGGHRVRVAFGPPMRFDQASDSSASANQLRNAVEKLWNAI